MIRFVSHLGAERGDPSFAHEVMEKSQSYLGRCYQCLTCSAGCPVAFAMDYTPHQIIRMVQFGFKERVLGSSAIWLCASCQTCAARCPHDIDIVRLMDSLRELALGEKRVTAGNIPRFHAAFVECIRRQGRIHELSLVMRYLLTSGSVFKISDLFGYIIFGLKMLSRGKLALLPSQTEGRAAVKRIFQRTAEFRD